MRSASSVVEAALKVAVPFRTLPVCSLLQLDRLVDQAGQVIFVVGSLQHEFVLVDQVLQLPSELDLRALFSLGRPILSDPTI